MNTRKLVLAALFTAMTVVLQSILQPLGTGIVGPIVNFMLIISLLLIDVRYAVLIGVITPFIALMVGLMPIFALVPFIAVSNAILIVVFAYFRNKENRYVKYLGLVAAAFFKFVFLAVSIRTIVPFFVSKIPDKLIAAMTLPQFYNAIIGGALALLVYSLLPKNIKE